jgi:hypothetical protein
VKCCVSNDSFRNGFKDKAVLPDRVLRNSDCYTYSHAIWEIPNAPASLPRGNANCAYVDLLLLRNDLERHF